MTGDAVRGAIAALRAGRPVRIEGGGQPLGIIAVEIATTEMLGLLDAGATAQLLISGARAQALSLANQREAADPDLPVLLERSDWLDQAAALQLADPSQDFERGPIGPLKPIANAFAEESGAAIRLARSAGLLPALWLVDPGAAVVRLSVAEMEAAAAMPEMRVAARASLPLDGLPDTQIVAFRASDDGQEHVALLVGSFGGGAPLVRLHSECLTGDVFGSLKCDCGPQLKEALRLIGAAGGGILLYLRQEGRGIGLTNKLRAYALQDRGLDTVEANRRLGFADDERDYRHAAAILRQLGVDGVRLLTNNPAKVAGLEAAGIAVTERVAHHMPTNPHNADYVATKKAKSGHL